MTIKKGHKRAAVTLTAKQQKELKELSQKYALSQSKILAQGLSLLIAQENAHFDVGLKKCRHS